uniref:WD repeat domain 27 n=1 Tax=Sinocyclocheilus anshuiensis TaxID=1608454 RepID=A0A671QMJ4_9TELE
MTGRKVYLFNRSVSDIVLAAGADHTIQVFDMNQGCMATQIPDAHCRAVHHLTQNKGSPFCTQALESYNLFLSSTVTDGLKLWDLRTARCVCRYDSHVNRYHHCTAVFSPCGRFIAYIYDTRSSNFLHKLPRHSETVLNVAFNPANPEVKTY